MKYALIKQDVYQDLYVCSHKERDVKNILFSSIMRVGPFGLIKDLNADFYIIKEDEIRCPLCGDLGAREGHLSGNARRLQRRIILQSKNPKGAAQNLEEPKGI